MSVIRIVETTLVSDAASQLGARLQAFVKRTLKSSEQAADVLLALVTPAAAVTLVMGLWRLTSDVGWTETFPITTGFFSHWLVWIALAIGLRFGASAMAPKLLPVEAPNAAEVSDQRQ
jgi:hypothetical protein